MELTDPLRQLLGNLIERIILPDRQRRFIALLDTRKGVEKFRKGLCHFQSNLRVEAGVPPASGDWWDSVAPLAPREVFVFGSRHCEVMPFKQAKDDMAICTFVMDVDRRFIVYLGDAGDHLIFEGGRPDGRGAARRS